MTITVEVRMNSLRVDVLAFEAPCERCSFSFWWVFALLPSHRPRGDEFTTTDFPAAVETARDILADPDSEPGLREQLADRPAWQRGRGFNPNRCASCGHQAVWHTFEKIVDEALYGGWIHAAVGRVPVERWRAVRGGGQGISWPYC
ncbi:hypothetical protein ACIF6I_14395 [Streptomyces microflavus]|uniref:hypothetical protein n=1 Tax=Streptomyces microflavus TaxID=1919 RepID=UPI0037CF9A84